MTAAFGLVFAVFPSHAQAAFNTLPQDCPTLSVANDTTQQNAALTCWAPTVSASAGDHINVRVYYHNTGSSAADAVLRLNDPTGSRLSTFNFTGSINMGNTGSASANLSSQQTLTLNQVQWFHDHGGPYAIPGSTQAIFTGGLDLGMIPANSSGSVVVSFIVGNSTVVTGNCAINSFTINGSSTYANVPYGTSSTLAWNTSNCTTATVNGHTYTGSQAQSGSVVNGAITENQNFTLTASGTNSLSRTVTAFAGAQNNTTCGISAFTANGQTGNVSIAYNSTVTLAWTTTNCTSVTVLGHTYTGSQAQSGSVVVSNVTNSVSYLLTAVGSDGTHTSGVSVNVGGQSASCSIGTFTANGSNTTTISSGGSAVIAWTTTNCTSVIVNGTNYIGTQANSYSFNTGSLSTGTYTYTMVATDSAGHTDTRTVTVIVGSTGSTCSIGTFTGNGQTGSVSVSANSSVLLSWNTTNCTSVSLNGTTYTGSQAQSNSINTGNLSSGTYTYTLIATDVTGHADTRTITVTTGNNNYGNCQITNFQPYQTSVNSGNSTILSWTLSGCTGSVTLSGPNFSNITINNSSISTGPVYQYSQYTLTAYGSDGNSTSQTTYVNIGNNNNNNGGYNQSCVISTFTANGSNSAQVTAGATANINWSTYGCSSVTVSGPGVYSQNATGSMQTSAVYGIQTYTITGYNLFYNSPVSQTITVSSGGSVVTPTALNPITTIATNVTRSSARLNGLVPANQNAGTVTAYFEYGTNASLGSQTNPQTISAYTLLNYYNTIYTSANTTYYFRAVMNTNGVITHGDIVSFTTPSASTYVPPVVVNNVTYGTGTGSAYASITISDMNQNVTPGDTISYTINYKNISSSTLSNATINVVLPKGVTFKGSTQGMSTTDNTIVATLGSLEKGAQGFINVQASVDSDVVSGNNLLATATLTFTTPSGATDSAVAYYMNTVNIMNTQGAFAFGAGFFPSTLLGWILLLAIIIILILLARHYSIMARNMRNQNQTTTVFRQDTHSDAGHH